MFSPRELTAVITVLTETGDTNHSMGRLMRGRERAREWGVMDRWMERENIKEDKGREREGCSVLGMETLSEVCWL